MTYVLMGGGHLIYARDTVALCLMFSAGTFLYVATAHILPEVQASEPAGRPLRWKFVLLLVTGIIFPAFINVEHEH